MSCLYACARGCVTLLTAFAFFLPFPDLGTSSHSSRTFSRTFEQNKKDNYWDISN